MPENERVEVSIDTHFRIESIHYPLFVVQQGSIQPSLTHSTVHIESVFPEITLT